MPVSPLVLSSDSLIVAAALSGVLPRRHALPLIALFGVCDAVASMIGPALAVQIPLSGLLPPIFLALWGSLIMLNLPRITRWARSPRWAYLLPLLLALDNLVAPSGASAAVTGLASSTMAALGFGLGFAVSRERRLGAERRRFSAMSLAAAGLLLAM